MNVLAHQSLKIALQVLIQVEGRFYQQQLVVQEVRSKACAVLLGQQHCVRTR